MLQLQNFGTLIANMGARVQGACTTLLDMSVGTVVRAIQEASAAQALWLQALIPPGADGMPPEHVHRARRWTVGSLITG